MESTLFRNLMAVSQRFWKRLVIASLLVAVSNSLLVVNPLIFRRALLAMDPAFVEPTFRSLIPWMITLLFISLLASLFKYQMRMAFISVSRDVEAEVRSLLYDRIQEQTASFFDRYPIGSLMSRLTNDISAYREVLGPGIMYPMFFLTLIIPSLTALYSISFHLALLSTIPIIILPLLILSIRNTTYHTSLKVQNTLGDLSTITQERYTGIRIEKAYCTEKETREQFAKYCRKFVRLNLWLSGIKGIFFPFLAMITKLTTIFLVLFSGWIILRAWGTLNAADFVSFMWIQSFVFIPVLMLGWVLPIYIQGSASYQRLVEIYDEPIEVKDISQALEKIPEHADIEFKELTFRYPSAPTPTLKNLTIHIKSGSFVGITGPVGAGKTTLFRILQRDYEIPNGMVFIAGKEIHEYSQEALQKAFIAVEQTPFIFSTTIRENLQIAENEASIDDFDYATQKADLLTTIQEFPRKYQTQIGERGVTLSGGQKQRLALARALLVDRQIYLFDDIFSAVDFASERRIFEEIKKHIKGKTALMTTHRVSVLNEMDQIIYMMNGEVVESGAPKDLISLQGHFAALVELQRWQKI